MGKKATNCLLQSVSWGLAGMGALVPTGGTGRGAGSCQGSQLAQQQAANRAACGSPSS